MKEVFYEKIISLKKDSFNININPKPLIRFELRSYEDVKLGKDVLIPEGYNFTAS
jgi:hypothetical protein